MLSGKLHSFQGNSRTTVLLALIKAQGLDIELVPTSVPVDPQNTEYRKLNPLGRVPTFVGDDGFVLPETIAISIYLASQDESSTLLGKDKKEYVSILRWMSYANQEVLPQIAGWFRPLVGGRPYIETSVEAARKATLASVEVYERYFSDHEFLVGESLTLADLFTTSLISRGFQYVLDKHWRAQHPNTTRWFESICRQPIWKAVVDRPLMCEEAVTYKPPK